jgi:hypothetical protein
LACLFSASGLRLRSRFSEMGVPAKDVEIFSFPY